MPQRTLDLGQVESLVQDFYLPVIRDQFFLSNALYYRLQPRARYYSGGRAIFQPLSFAPEGGGGQWWAGVDKMDTRVRNPITGATFYRKNFTVPIVISRDEEDSVGGDTAIVDLTHAKMEIARPTAVDGVGTALFNDGTDPKQIGGLALIARNDPSLTLSYGGINQGTNAFWRNQTTVAPNATSVTPFLTGGTNNTFAGVRGFGPIGKLWVKIGRASAKRPTMIVSNWGSYQDYHDSLAGVGINAGTASLASMSGGQRFVGMDADLASAGFENVKYKSAAWVVDERAPHIASLATDLAQLTSPGNILTNTTDIEPVYFLHEPALNLVIHTNRNMSFDAWKEPPDQRIRVGYIDWAGEVVCSERRAQGVIPYVSTTATS